MWKPNLDQMSVVIALKKESNWSLLGHSCQGPCWSRGAGKSLVPGHGDRNERLCDLASSSAVSHSSSFKGSGVLPSSPGDLYTAD